MPHISLKLYPGRSKGELEIISHVLQRCLVDTVGWKPSDISVSIEEIEKEKFIEKINEKIASEVIYISSDHILK